MPTTRTTRFIVTGTGARVRRRLADLPMDVVFADVHHVDIMVAPLADPVRVKLIAWLCAASHYMYVTPVLVNGRQSITQHDMARSLFDLTQSPLSGMPRTLTLDNGGDMARFKKARHGLRLLPRAGRACGSSRHGPTAPGARAGWKGRSVSSRRPLSAPCRATSLARG